MLLRLLAPLTVAAFTLFATAAMGAGEPQLRMPVRIVDVRGATALVSRGAAVLDARDAAAFAQGHIPGAQLYAWQSFTGDGARRGRVHDDLAGIARSLSGLGVDTGRPALVYGAMAQGWGEEGHAAWLLLLLGHPDVAVLDGGFSAWRAAGRPVVTATARARPGAFEARARRELLANVDDVRRARTLVDVRSKGEFHGATPFGEARGGHIEGARHLDWRTLLDEGGRVVSPARLTRALFDAGVDPAGEIVTVCSCGVRSAFVATALLARGVGRVRNYDGSMAEWSADPGRPMAQ
jgi:thiosulfate/3-mercaptopyruvate sulfurtransferase